MDQSLRLRITPQLEVTLPLVIQPNGVSYYSFNLLGKAEWNRLIATNLSQRLFDNDIIDKSLVLLTVEAKAIGLTELIAQNLELSTYIVVRKECKSYMQNPISFSGTSITSGRNEYWIDQCDIDALKGKNVIICDDVVSSGGTLSSLIQIVKFANGHPLTIICALVEGINRDEFQGIPIISCAFLPLPSSK